MTKIIKPNKYIVASDRQWNSEIFHKIISRYKGKWYYIDSSKKLTTNKIKQMNPKYIFFIHWSSKISNELNHQYKCIGFHMTDLPYGRGGSPLQNLILKGFTKTKLTAFQMTNKLDAGSVYLKKNLSLKGSAQEIYRRASLLAARMIKEIISYDLKPYPQIGKITAFKRRKPEQSEIINQSNLTKLYDFIRMLDADGYPKAFLIYQNFRYEFQKAKINKNSIITVVTIEQISK